MSNGSSGFILASETNHKVPWEIRRQSQRLQITCPGVQVRIRKQPSPDAPVVEYLQDQEIFEAFLEQEGAYFRLTNGLGYCLVTIPGVSYQQLAVFRNKN